MTASPSLICQIVGADREAEARHLVEMFASLHEDHDDPALAYIIRRRLLDSQPLATIATETGWDRVEVESRFLAWAEALKVAMELLREDRRSA